MLPKFNRRRFLAVGALTATVPTFLTQTARALAAEPKTAAGRNLVMIQLAGGNDGLNTLVPIGNDAYYKARPSIAIAKSKALTVTDNYALHPELGALRKLYDAGFLSVVTNVGYPNPSRSHFRATEIWETSVPDKETRTGWLGRYFDAECSGVASPMMGLQLGEKLALTFAHTKPRAVTLTNPSLFQWEEGAATEAMGRLNRVQKTDNTELDFLQRTANETLSFSRRIQDALKETRTAADYAPFNFSQSLKFVARMIAAEVPTRVYYLTLGGFDTHVTQVGRHAALLQELSEGLGSFLADLKAMGRLDNTLVMTFSEFGRRVAENQQKGTDHGTANVMLLAGGKVKPGINGGLPDLADLDDGDLKFKIDFRSVYAAVLGEWFGADASKLVGADVKPVPILR